MKEYLLETFIIRNLSIYQFEAIETFLMENHFVRGYYNPAESGIIVNFSFKIWETAGDYLQYNEGKELDYISFKDKCASYGYNFNEYSNNRWISDDSIIIDDSNFYILKKLEEQISNSKKKPKNLIIKASVNKLPQKQFYGFKDLENVTITSPLDSISAQCFAYCENLKTVHLPCTIRYIRYEAFRGCSKLLGVSFSDKLYEIEDHAFEDCFSLNQLRLPTNLKRIGICAFRNCGLQNLILPIGINYIGTDCFTGNPLDYRNVEYYENPEVREARKCFEVKKEYLIREKIIEVSKKKIFSEKVIKVLENQFGIKQRDLCIEYLKKEKEQLYYNLDNLQQDLEKEKNSYKKLKSDYDNTNAQLINKSHELTKQKELTEENKLELEKLRHEYSELREQNLDLKKNINSLNSKITGLIDDIRILDDNENGNDAIIIFLSITLTVIMVLVFAFCCENLCCLYIEVVFFI